MVFTRSIYGFEDLFARMPGNDYLRHVTGMALVGVMMYLLLRYTGHYYVEGVGYATIQDILNGSLAAAGLVLLLAVAETAGHLADAGFGRLRRRVLAGAVHRRDPGRGLRRGGAGGCFPASTSTRPTPP